MKIKPEHSEHIRSEINIVLEKYNVDNKLVDEYETGQFARSDRVKDLQKRFCFDLAFGAGLNKFFCDELYPYMDDNHIYTALKKVCPKVKRRY